MKMAGHVLAVVPARSGSKGVPGKNIRRLGGRPLLAYAAEAARTSGVVDRLILSTEAEEIAQVGLEYGFEVPFLRPEELALDTTPMLPVIEHAVKALETEDWSPDIILVLQPTSPLRRPEHLSRAVRYLRETDADSVVSVVEFPRHLSPDYVMRIENDKLEPFLPEGLVVTRRQDARLAYVRDGTVYACRRDTLVLERSLYGSYCHPLVLPTSESLTIDSNDDWTEAERRIAEIRRS